MDKDQLIEELVKALKEIEAHHVKLNNRVGRNLDHSYTLSVVNAALSKAAGFSS